MGWEGCQTVKEMEKNLVRCWEKQEGGLREAKDQETSQESLEIWKPSGSLERVVSSTYSGNEGRGAWIEDRNPG